MSGLSREDRARLEVLGQYVDCEVALALALIDQQAKALEAAEASLRSVTRQTTLSAARSIARAALEGSKQ